MMRVQAKRLVAATTLGSVMLLSGCTRDWKFQPVDMWNRSRLKPYEPVSASEGLEVTASRPLPAGTVARGQLRVDEAMYNGTLNGSLVTTIPAAAMQGVTMRQLVERGKERYDINCLPCHGIVGNGDGMIVKRGFAPPPPYSEQRLRDAPIGHFYDVMTNGYGAMYSYASRVTPRDRWAIAAYIRVLQRSQTASAADIPASERAKVKTPEQILRSGAPMSQTPQEPGSLPLPNTTKKPSAEAPAAPNDSTGQSTD